MKKLRSYLLLLTLALSVCPAWAAAKVYGVGDVPNTRLADAGSHVSDPDGILSAATVSRVNQILASLQSATSVDVFVVAIPSIGSDTPEDFAVRLFQRWGIGKKGDDNGLLILLVTEDRYIRFEVGYGLEGTLTDAISKRIQVQRMNPYFANGDWDGGIIAGVEAVDELLTDPDSQLASTPDEDSEALWGAIVLVLFNLGIILMIAIVASRKARKCPRCGTKMKIVDQSTVKISPTVRLVTTTYRCPKCGYTDRRNRKEDIGSAIAGGMLGGGMGRGFGGGGFGGGSFGGGMSGGGGATSRF